MKKIGLLLTLLAALHLAVPPTLYATDCYTQPNAYIGYFPSCACTACAGWAFTNCTECTDGQGNWCQTTDTGAACDPVLHQN